MVKQSTPEARSRPGIILGDMAVDLSQLVQRSLCVEEVVIHWGRRWRTSLAGTVPPCAASRRPSSRAARVFLVFIVQDAVWVFDVEFLPLGHGS